MRVLILLLTLVACHVSANDKTLQVAVNIGPPWAFYQEGEGVVGIDVDIIRHVCKTLGYETEFHLLAYNRLIGDFRAGKYDIASPAAFDADNGHLTVPYLPYEDVAVTLSRRAIELNSIDDLHGKRIIAYQGAKEVLGEHYAEVVAEESYLEEAAREVQLTLLANDRADVVVGEKRLLTYIMRKRFPQQPLQIHPIFDSRPYGAIMKSRELRDAFNREIASMKASGLYQEMLRRWQ